MTTDSNQSLLCIIAMNKSMALFWQCDGLNEMRLELKFCNVVSHRNNMYTKAIEKFVSLLQGSNENE